MIARAVWILFFLSGACGLIYEVGWTRHLGLILGNTVQSLSVVLSAFMAGLALGSFVASRWIKERGGLLRLYGWLELFIGLYCLILPYLFQVVVPLYQGLYGSTGGGLLPFARFATTFMLLLIPTTCMGATLPILSQYMVRSHQNLSRTAGALYAVNTFGAVMGAAGAGFFLLPYLGRTGTNLTAVLGNVLLGVVAIILDRRVAPTPSAAPDKPDKAAETPTQDKADDASTAETPQEGTIQPAAVKAAAGAFVVTGFAAMATQIGWTRALSLSIGSSTYAFSLIVSVFIMGLAFGGAWGSRVARKVADPVRALAVVLLLIGLLAILVVEALGWAPIIFFWLIAIGSQWGFGGLLALETLGVALLLFLPTFLMGATMPLTLQIWHNRAEGAGGVSRTVGGLYALNTIGSIAGSLVGGLVMLPLLQIQTTLQVSAFLYTICGAALFVYSTSYTRRRAQAFTGILAGATFLLVVVLPRWDPLRMNAGAYLMRNTAGTQAVREGRLGEAWAKQEGHFVYYREGASATVAVVESHRGLTLTIGGKPDASSHGDMSTQVGLTLIPELLHSTGAKEVLVIGMGSGVSAGAALSPESVERVDLVEISPEVMEASWHFRKFNGLKYARNDTLSPLAEDKLEVILNDGRNHLLLTDRRYDVIASEPSNPWISGIGNLFTRESFDLCRRRLKPGGVMAQWLHRYGMGEEEFKSVLRTFAEVFPHAQLWCVLPGQDYLIVGSESPLRIHPRTIRDRLLEKRTRRYLMAVGLDTPQELLACFMADGARMKELAELSWVDADGESQRQPAPIHTDDNMLLEFAAPRTLVAGSSQFPVADWRISAERIIDFEDIEPGSRLSFLEQLDLSVLSRRLVDMMFDRRGDAKELLQAAIALVSKQAFASKELDQLSTQPGQRKPKEQPPKEEAELKAWNAEQAAQKMLARGRLDQAEEMLEAAVKAKPGRYQATMLLAEIAARRKKTDACLTLCDQAKTEGAPAADNIGLRARVLIDASRWKEADAALSGLLSQPNATRFTEAAPLWAQRGRVALALKQRDAAIESLQHAMRLGDKQAAVQRYAAEVWQDMGQLTDRQMAVEALYTRLALEPLKTDSYKELSEALQQLAEAHADAKQQDAWLENMRQARAALVGSIKIHDADLEARILLAQLWHRMGNEHAPLYILKFVQTVTPVTLTLPEELRPYLEKAKQLLKEEQEKEAQKEREKAQPK